MKSLQDKDPWQVYASMREAGTLCWEPGLNCYLASSYKLARRVLLDEKHFRRIDAQLPGGSESAHGLRGNLAALTGEEHFKLHSLMTRLIDKAASERFAESGVFSDVANDCINSFAARGEADLASEYADRIPMNVGMRLLGLDPLFFKTLWEAKTIYWRWNETQGTDPYDNIVRSAAAKIIRVTLSVLLDLAIETGGPADGSVLKEIMEHGSEVYADWSDSDTIRAIDSYIAGGETSWSLRNLIWFILHDDHVRSEFSRADRETKLAYVEEMLRVWGPVHTRIRKVVAPLRFGGTDLKVGDLVCALPASGNHDAAKYPDAEQIAIGRKGAGVHLAFGAGAHYCIGSDLAQAELADSIGALLDRLPDVRCVPSDDTKYINSHLRSWSPINVRFTPERPTDRVPEDIAPP